MPQSLAPHCSGADIAVLRPSTLMASGPKGEDAQHGAREIHASRIALSRMRIDAKQCAEQKGQRNRTPLVFPKASNQESILRTSRNRPSVRTRTPTVDTYAQRC